MKVQLTVNYYLSTSREGKPLREESFPAKLLNIPGQMSLPLELLLTKAEFIRHPKSDLVTAFRNAYYISRRVCFVATEDLKKENREDVFQVCDVAKRSGAKVVLLCVQPSAVFTSLPVIKVDASFEKHLLHKDGFMRIQVSDSAEHGSKDFAPNLSYADALKKSEVKKEKKDVAHSLPRGRQAPNAEKSQDSHWNNFSNWVFSKMWTSEEEKQVKNLVSLVKEDPTLMSCKPRYRAFQEIVQAIKAIGGEHLVKAADGISEKTKNLAVTNIYHVVLGFLLFEEAWSSRDRFSILSSYVFSVLARLEISHRSPALEEICQSTEIASQVFGIISTFVSEFPTWMAGMTVAPVVPKRVVAILLWLKKAQGPSEFDGIWPEVSVLVNDASAYLRDEGELTIDLLGPLSSVTFMLSAYNDIDVLMSDLAIISRLIYKSETGQRIEVNSAFGKRLEYFAGSSTKNGVTCFSVMSRLKFHMHDRKVKEAIVKAVVYNSKNFKELDALVAGFDVQDELLPMVKEICGNCLIERLREDSVGVKSVTGLFELNIARCLATSDGADAALCFVRCNAQSSKWCSNRYMALIELLRVLYEKFVVENWLPASVDMTIGIVDCLRIVHKAVEGRAVTVGDLFAFGESHRGAFSCQHDMNSTAQILVSLLPKEAVLREYRREPRRVLNLIKKFDAIVHPGDFVSQLSLWFVQTIDSLGPSMDEVSQFSNYLLNRPVDTANSFSRRSAAQLVLGAYTRWAPVTLDKVMDCKKPFLEALLKVGDVPEVQRGLNSVVTAWVERYNDGLLCMNDYASYLRRHEELNVNLLSKVSKSKLPSKVNVEQDIDSFAKLLREVRSMNIIVWEEKENPKSSHVRSTQTKISDLITFYKVKDATASRYSKLQCETSMDRISVQEAKEAKTFLSCLWENHAEALRVGSYFAKHKSVLFEMALSGITECKMSISSFLEGVVSAKQMLEKLLSLEEPYSTIRKTFEDSEAYGYNVLSELRVLEMCPYVMVAPHVYTAINHIAAVLPHVPSIRSFASCSRQFKFAFVEADNNFLELEGAAELFVEPETAVELGQMVEKAKLTDQLLASTEEKVPNVSERMKALVPVFGFFEVLSSCGDVWTFVRENKWDTEDGLEVFNKEYQNITNISLSEISFEKTVLDCLGSTVRLVSIVSAVHKNAQMAEVLQKIEEKVIRKTTDYRFLQLRAAQENISKIKGWFEEGMDDRVAIVNKLKAIVSSGYYLLRISDSIENLNLSLILRYNAREDGCVEVMTETELIDFCRQLKLNQDGSSESGGKANMFVDECKILCKVSKIMNTLFVTGFSAADAPFKYKAARQSLSHAKALLKESEANLGKCGDWLTTIRARCPISLLFWTEELRNMHNALQTAVEGGASSSTEANKLMRIIPFLHRISPEALETQKINALLPAFASVVSTTLARHEDSPWLEGVSELVEGLHAAMGEPRKISSTTPSTHTCTIHSVMVGKESKKNMALHILEYIYVDRLPEAHEFFDCVNGASDDNLRLFLERSSVFRDGIFVLLGVEKLTGKQQDLVRSFLADKIAINAGVNLHCIQNNDNVLGAFPWVRNRSWETKDLMSCQDPHGPKSWVANMVKAHESLKRVSIFWSPSSGTGKTRAIRDQLSALRQRLPDIQIATINIHEGTSMESIREKLKLSFSPECRTRAVYFSFSFMEPSERFLESLNSLFQDFILTGALSDAHKGTCFYGKHCDWHVFVELQSWHSNQHDTESPMPWLQINIPILAMTGTIESPPIQFVVDEECRRVCTYLRAYKDGTIDRKFTSVAAKKSLVFVIDESGSMAGGKFSTATQSMSAIINSHIQIDDTVGVLFFSSYFREVVPAQAIKNDAQKQSILSDLRGASHMGGGTMMYTALMHALQTMCTKASPENETWVVCLTDGVSSDSMGVVQMELLRNPRPGVHFIVIGVGLSSMLHENMRLLCNKFDEDPKGLFIPTAASPDGIDDAFASAASRIPVSQTFELDGALSDGECRDLIASYHPPSIDPCNKLLCTFWIKFLFRRVSVFDKSEDFNYNEEYDNLGSSLMQLMLSEAEELLQLQQNSEGSACNRTQLIYDQTERESPRFRLLCTNPDRLDREVRRRFDELRLPGFHVPETWQLKRRSTLDRYLSQALCIPLQEQEGRQVLTCIDRNKFVLTLDFTVKLLNIHERVIGGVPCIMEGETGVSKTALAKMYSILINEAEQAKARDETSQRLLQIQKQIRDHLGRGGEISTSLDSMIQHLEPEQIGAIADIILNSSQLRDPIFKAAPEEMLPLDSTAKIQHYLEWFSSCELEPTFFDINVHAAMTESYFVDVFQKVDATAKKCVDSTIVVFLDEVNASSVMGLMKEIIVDRSISGCPLRENIVVVAACNPARTRITAYENCREADLGKEWVSGHYQVSPIVGSMKNIMWQYGSLSSEEETDFIFKRMDTLSLTLSTGTKSALTDYISCAQETLRSLADEHLFSHLKDVIPEESKLQDICSSRARSVVSLRDIQRAFSLFLFFVEQNEMVMEAENDEEIYRKAILLSIALVYFARLDRCSRKKLVKKLEAQGRSQENEAFEDVYDAALSKVVGGTTLPEGTAATYGLKETVFMTLMCSLSRTPLTIVGPPGCSKTLSVNIVLDNANGEESKSKFYRKHPRLDLFHYQCSKYSNSNEVESILLRAIQRQETDQGSKHLSIVVLDEAGLTEESKESLKVMHYYLEGHMSAKCPVAFVAITNHVLDAAKSNRCICLLRPEPGTEELETIASGVLFDLGSSSMLTKMKKEIEVADTSMFAHEFVTRLCESYVHLIKDDSHFKWFKTFFGLRDFIYFLRALKFHLEIPEPTLYRISAQDLLMSLGRNFNGCTERQFQDLIVAVVIIVLKLKPEVAKELIKRHVPETFDLVKCAISRVGAPASQHRSRYKLIIDETEDDSIMRLLKFSNEVQSAQENLFKLSGMEEDVEIEKLALISGIKFAALTGKVAVLSQTESFSESFYDLFNQNFRRLEKDGKVSYFANIAAGGVSRPCLVHDDFRCIVHIRGSQLSQVPAPFLNRFEKFRLSIRDVMQSRLKAYPNLLDIVQAAIHQARRVLASCGIYGFVEGQTLESIILDMSGDFVHPPDKVEESHGIMDGAGHSSLAEMGHIILNTCFPGSFAPEDIAVAIDAGRKFLLIKDADVLEQFISKGNFISRDSIEAQVENALSSENSSNVQRILKFIIEMALARKLIFKCLPLATPEAIFAHRHIISSEVLKRYFSQNHGSLVEFLSSSVSAENRTMEPKLHLVYTKTDVNILSIPTWPPTDQDENNNHKGLVCNLAHEDPDRLMIVHLKHLKSESSVRQALDTWRSSSCRDLLLMLVDMGETSATEKLNFVRSHVEHDDSTCDGRKTFVAVCHYRASASRVRHAYPALFLGGWMHTYIDQVVGIEKTTVDVSKCMSLALEDKMHTSSYIEAVLRNMIPSSLMKIATSSVFQQGATLVSRRWDVNGDLSLEERHNCLVRLMSKNLGGDTLSGIVCRKVATLWTSDELARKLHDMSVSLVEGMSSLSLSSALYATLQDAFHAYLMDSLRYMNQARNLDLVANLDETIGPLHGLVYLLAEGFTGPPLEELLLHRAHSGMSKVMSSTTNSRCCCFPFFPVLSASIEELVNSAEAQNVRQISTKCTTNSVEDIARGMAKQKHSTSFQLDKISELHRTRLIGEDEQQAKRSKPLQEAMEYVSTRTEEERLLLYKYYIEDLVVAKFHRASGVVADWLLSKIQSSIDSPNLLLKLHLLVRKEEQEIWNLYSVQNLGLGTSSSLSTTHGRNSIFSDFLTKNVKELQTQNPTTTEFLSEMRQISTLCHQEIQCDRQKSRALRALCFLHCLCQDQGVCSTLKTSEVQFWTTTVMSAVDEKDVSLGAFFQRASAELDLSEEALFNLQNKLIRIFFSDWWLNLHSPEADVKDFIDFVQQDPFFDQRVALCTASMESISKCSSQRAECVVELVPHLTFSRTIASLICSEHHPTGASSNSVSNQDSRRLRYIPQWLRREIQEKATTPGEADFASFPTFEASFEAAQSNLAEILFRMVFRRLSDNVGVETSSLRTVFLASLNSIEKEIAVTKDEYLDQKRLASLNKIRETRGTDIGPTVVEASVLIFVLRVAVELAQGNEYNFLNFAEGEEAERMLCNILNSRTCNYRNVFLYTLRRLKGVSFIVQLLQGPLQFLSWKDEWIHESTTSQNIRSEELSRAEGVYRHAFKNEVEKERSSYLCPRCRRVFEVPIMNCGIAVCGKTNSQVLGCGHSFIINEAPRYNRDEKMLRRLKAELLAEEDEYQSAVGKAGIWKSVSTFSIPATNFHLSSRNSDEELVAPAIMNRLPPILDLLDREAFNLRLFPYIPDLIEFYIWLHSSLRFIIRKEDARCIKLKNLMDKNVLTRRFDTGTVADLQRIWTQATIAVDLYVTASKGYTFWKCKQVWLPFESLADAPLVSVLSEGNHPTEKHDFLFLIISDIGEKYNSFVTRVHSIMSAHQVALVAPQQEIHPKMAISSFWRTSGLAPDVDMSAVLSRYWIRGAFDIRELENDIMNQLGLRTSMPPLADLLVHLRVKMQYSETNRAAKASENTLLEGKRSSTGLYFSQSLDMELFDEVLSFTRTLLFEEEGTEETKYAGAPSTFQEKAKEIKEGAKPFIRRCAYSSLRELLSGVQSVIAFVQQRSELRNPELTITEVASHASEQGNVATVMSLWFAGAAKNNQLASFLGALPLRCIRLFVLCVGEYLATEAYLFGHLPLYLEDDMPTDVSCKLESKIFELVDDESIGEDILQLVKSFVQDNLSFCEKSTIDVDANMCMSSFLLAHAMCTKEDVIFGLLPETLMVRHYISLRKFFHQLRFKLLDRQENRGKAQVSSATQMIRRKTDSRGDCWLWSSENVMPDSVDKESGDIHERSSGLDRSGFWFAGAVTPSTPVIADKDVPCGEEDGFDQFIDRIESAGTPATEKRAASIIQKWWKQVIQQKREDKLRMKLPAARTQSIGVLKNDHGVSNEKEGSSMARALNIEADNDMARCSKKAILLMLTLLLVMICVFFMCLSWRTPMTSSEELFRASTTGLASTETNNSESEVKELEKDQTAGDGEMGGDLTHWLREQHVDSTDLNSKLSAFGARYVSDLRLIHEADPNFFESLNPLDAFKLKKAIGALS